MTQGDEPQGPYPARFWWLKRFALAAVGGVLLLTATRAAWGWEAQRRFDQALAPVLAAGWPVRGEDLNPPGVADAVNGAYFLLRATKIAEVDAAAPSIVASTIPAICRWARPEKRRRRRRSPLATPRFLWPGRHGRTTASTGAR